MRIIIDANLLVLFVVGRTSRQLIGKHRRLREYSVEDYDRLIRMTDGVGQVVVTPNTLTETSNLLALHKNPERSRFLDMLQYVMENSDEVNSPWWNPASHRERRGARLTRREEGAYWAYATDEQRRQAGCIAARMQRGLSPRAVKVSSADASRNRAFRRLGLTDAVLLEVVSAETPLLTVDLDLFVAASAKDPDAAVNFRHLDSP